MTLKIGLVTGEYPPMEGGVGAFTQQLAMALADKGHELHIITSRKAKPTNLGRSIWDIREPVTIGYAMLHARIGRWWWPANSAIASVVSRYNLDIVNVQYQAAAFDMTLPGINFLPWRLKGMTKTIATFHDLRVPYLFPKAGPLRKWLVHHLARSAEGVIVTNWSDYDDLTKARVPDSRLRQIPIGSNISAHTVVADEVRRVRRQLGLGGQDLLLGYFGFVSESKGADALIAVLPKLDEAAHLVFIGGQTGSSDSGSNRAFLEQLHDQINSLGLEGRVHWSGFLSDRDVSIYLNAADLMVMPYRDGVSLRRGTLMAALAHGRPLVTTAPARPIPELVHGQNVWLTPVDDPDALSDAIQRLADNPELRRRLGEGAMQLAQLFTWDKIAAQTAEFYQSLVDGS